ncbi:pseudouridine synthase [Alkalimarinus sediminis]|uniref:Pseudouridine synthase n=1 Tax=Alkalimarinus sediminis TaxID=1632866 RepID=A0A9E8HKP0_9ALTE|nr:pseudouridine synthase [Alkalimarinus sediminis]UZW76410.1 pseudouridine synthase [Alkalimarinus sediminis]
MQPQADPFIVPLCEDSIETLYEDEHILLINKPTGLLSLSGKHPQNFDSVHYRLVKEYPSATLVHRLDFGTSGLLVVALSKAANANLTKQFQARTVRKSYTAVLHGLVEGDCGTIDIPIIKDKDNFPLQKVCYETGKVAKSDYSVIERLMEPRSTRVTFRPVTGRTHQLRVHSRELGHPILGCDLYGTDEAFSMGSRLMLHATTIEFEHPASGQRFNANCPCPF